MRVDQAGQDVQVVRVEDGLGRVGGGRVQGGDAAGGDTDIGEGLAPGENAGAAADQQVVVHGVFWRGRELRDRGGVGKESWGK